MFKFLLGVAFGAAGYWAWQSFGRDLLGLGNDQDTSYGGFNSGGSSGSTAYGGGTISSGSTGSSSGSPTGSTTASASGESPASGT